MNAFSNGMAAEDLNYELYSVVVHRGGAHGGHYYSLTRDVHGEGAWSEPKAPSKQTSADFLELESPASTLHAIVKEATRTAGSPMDISAMCVVRGPIMRLRPLGQPAGSRSRNL